MAIFPNNKNLDTLLEYIANPIIFLTLDYKIININTAAIRVYNWEKQYVLNKNFNFLCKKHKLPNPFYKNKSKIFKKEVLKNIENIINSKKIEQVILWTICCTKNDKMKINGFILIGNNITNLRKEQDKNFQLDSIIAAMPNSVYWYDKNCTYLGHNNNSAKMLGVSREEALGKNFKDFAKKFNWSKQFLKDLAYEAKQILSTGKADLDKEELPFRIANGKTIYQLSSKVPLYDKKGKGYGILGISVDITERKKIEQELAKARYIAEQAKQLNAVFVNNLEYDIRTAAISIIEMAQKLTLNIIKNNKNDAVQQKKLSYLATAGKELLNLLNNILVFETVEGPLAYNKFKIKELIHNVLRLEEPAVKLKDLDLTAEFSGEIPDELIGDNHRLKSILFNLIGNAIKFTDDGYIKIIVDMIPAKYNRECLLKFVIQDTGRGISLPEQKLIYEKFSPITATINNEKNKNTTNLGLRIVKQFIEDMGGKIEVESEMGVGTTFICTIPFGYC